MNQAPMPPRPYRTEVTEESTLTYPAKSVYDHSTVLRTSVRHAHTPARYSPCLIKPSLNEHSLQLGEASRSRQRHCDDPDHNERSYNHAG